MKLSILHESDDVSFILQGLDDHFAELGYQTFIGVNYVGVSRPGVDKYVMVCVGYPKMLLHRYNKRSALDPINFDLHDPGSIPNAEKEVIQFLGSSETYP